MKHDEEDDVLEMSARDYFASQAMLGLLGATPTMSNEALARESYDVARCMMVERASRTARRRVVIARQPDGEMAVTGGEAFDTSDISRHPTDPAPADVVLQ